MTTIKTKLRGMKFCLGEEYPQKLMRFETGRQLKLVHESDNKVDPNATAVYADNTKLGYLSRAVAKNVHKALWRATAEISKITGKGFGMNLTITLRDTIDDSAVEQDSQIPG